MEETGADPCFESIRLVWDLISSNKKKTKFAQDLRFDYLVKPH